MPGPGTKFNNLKDIKDAIAKNNYLKDGLLKGKFKDAESLYRERVRGQMEANAGKNVGFTISQTNPEANNALNALYNKNFDSKTGKKIPINYCMGGACETAKQAGEPMKNSVDENGDPATFGGDFLNNYHAEKSWKENGYNKLTDPETMRSGDMVQLIKHDAGSAAVAHHVLMFHSYIYDKNGMIDPVTKKTKIIGARMFHNNGDGQQKFTNIVDDPTYTNGTDETNPHYNWTKFKTMLARDHDVPVSVPGSKNNVEGAAAYQKQAGWSTKDPRQEIADNEASLNATDPRYLQTPNAASSIFDEKRKAAWKAEYDAGEAAKQAAFLQKQKTQIPGVM